MRCIIGQLVCIIIHAARVPYIETHLLHNRLVSFSFFALIYVMNPQVLKQRHNLLQLRRLLSGYLAFRQFFNGLVLLQILDLCFILRLLLEFRDLGLV